MEEINSIKTIGRGIIKNIIKNIIKKEKLEADTNVEIVLNLIRLNKKETVFIGAILNPIAGRIKMGSLKPKERNIPN